MYRIKITVKEIRGHCAFNHKVGDEVTVDGELKGRVCLSALASMLPYIYSMRYGADFPWAENKDVITIRCPDPENRVVFEIKREKTEEQPIRT